MVGIETDNRPAVAFVPGGLLSTQNGPRSSGCGHLQLIIFLEVAALRGHMVASIAASAVCVTVYKGRI